MKNDSPDFSLPLSQEHKSPPRGELLSEKPFLPSLSSLAKTKLRMTISRSCRSGNVGKCRSGNVAAEMSVNISGNGIASPALNENVVKLVRLCQEHAHSGNGLKIPM